MKSLVTGASGFLGSHLVDRLLARGDQVTALQRHLSGAPREHLTVRQCDVLDAAAVRTAVEDAEAGQIYHLAAQSLPTHSWSEPAHTCRVNIEGTLNLLDAVRALDRPPVVLIVSSSSVYGEQRDGAPINEDAPLQPSTPYGASKAAVEHLCRMYADRYGVPIVRARPFFLIGPRKLGDVCSDWARRLVAIEQRGDGHLVVGNLDVTRDFMHARDGIDALMWLAARGHRGDAYNVCSGNGYRLQVLLDMFLALGTARVTVHIDPERVRSGDERVRVGDSSKLRALGWTPRTDIGSTLAEILDYWRRVRQAD